MTIENAITLLSKRAEYARAKADTPDKRRKADDFIEIVNTVIEHYNLTESLPSKYESLKETVKIIINLLKLPYGEFLIDTDMRSIRLFVKKWEKQSNNPYLILYNTAFDCYQKQILERDLRYTGTLISQWSTCYRKAVADKDEGLQDRMVNLIEKEEGLEILIKDELNDLIYDTENQTSTTAGRIEYR